MRSRLHCLAVTCLIVWLYCPAAIGQDTTNTLGHVSIASPNAASLGKFGDIPVSYNTGIPQISIPIHTVESGLLKLPMSLSYHASGLKVQENSSWVGAGWTLNAGGCITRTVVGSPDDRGLPGNITTNGHYSDYGYNSYLTISAGSSTVDDAGFARGYKDGEPDLYFFNFNGMAGKFYFNDDRTAVTIPETDFKILPTYTAGSGFTGFTITSSEGTRYYFGKTGNNNTSFDPIESTIPVTSSNGAATTNSAASSWFLNKIMSADGTDSITLSYVQEQYSYYNLSLAPVLSSEYRPTVFGKNGVDVVKNLVKGARLTQIDFANGYVKFTPSPSARLDMSDYSSVSITDNANTTAFSLGSISIFDNAGNCKKDSLFYSYWQDPTGLNSYLSTNFSQFNFHSDAYRLRLDSVQETSCDNSVKIPAHTFTYASGTPPRKLSFGVDHWGYYNGSDSNNVMVPTYTTITQGAGTTHGGAFRDAVWPAMQNGSLISVKYPTGGSTSFQYEPKCTYTINGNIYQEMAVASYAIHIYGQSATTQTMSFTLTGTGAVGIHLTNMSTNYAPQLVIKDASGTTVYNSNYMNAATKDANNNVIPAVFNTNINLPAGSYTGTFAYDGVVAGNLDNGAYGTITQWQYYPTVSTLLVGGLRIKSMTNNDALTTNTNTISYSYGGNANSTGGTLYSIPVYLQVIRNNLRALVTPGSCSPNGCQSCDGFNEHDYFVSPGAIQPLATVQGEHIGYDKVEVTRTGQGRTVYEFYGSNRFTPAVNDVCVRSLEQSSLCSPSIPNFPFAPLPFEFIRGELKFEGYYKQDGSFVKGTYHYPTYVGDPLVTPGLISIDRPGLYSNTEYLLQSGYKSQDKAVTSTYDDFGNSVTSTTTTYYGSPYHHSPTRIVTSTSTGDSLINSVKYSFDYRIGSCDAIPDSIPYFINQISADSLWMLDSVVKCTPQTNDGSNCRLYIYAQYRIRKAQHRVNLINYRRRSFVDPTNLLSNCYVSALGTADPYLKSILRLQNAYANVPIETSKWKNISLKQASLVQYDTSISPIGYAYPSKKRLLNVQQLSTTFSPSQISGNTISTDSRYLDESTYKYNAGNPSQVTEHNGVPISYLFDYQNKRPVAKISNGTIDQVSYTSFEADGNGGWSIPSTNRDSSTSATGRKCFNLQWGAISRSSLNSTTTYIVSYWTNSGPFTVSGTTQTRQGKTINGWSLFEHTISGVSTATVSGGARIDELRLYPATAQMETYTYAPMFGLTSMCDQRNVITYYNFDKLGRLKFIKDQDGNIVKTFDYHYQGQ